MSNKSQSVTLTFLTLAVWLVASGLMGPVTAFAQTYGLTNRAPIGPFLNNRLPSTAPSATTGWSTVNAFPNLTFNNPTFITAAPRSNRLYVCSQWGRIYSFVNDPAVTSSTVFLDVSSRTQVSDSSGLLGLVFHPEFGLAGSPNRGYFYVHYQYSPAPFYGYQPSFVRLSRFTVPDGSQVADPNSELVLIQQYDPDVWHNGGGMFFDEQGFLYLSLGDVGGASDSHGVAQKLNGGMFSGVIRIDVDRNPARSHPIRRQPTSLDSSQPSYTANYYIPNDNPFLDPGGSILEEFWAIGLRSPHRMSYDRIARQIWLGDVGQTSREEVNIIERGGNYQWPYLEGSLPGSRPKPNPLIGVDKPPVFEYRNADGNNSVMGGYVYRGQEHAAHLDGLYIFGDNGSGRIWALANNNTEAVYLCNMPPGSALTGLSSFGEDLNGELYMCQMGPQGKIYKLSRSGGLTQMAPALLSQTGAFANLATLEPAPGLIPYDVNSPLWSDGSAKRRWIAVPNDGSPYGSGERAGFSSTGGWTFPTGTVFVKHFEIPTDERNPSIIKRLETRFIVRSTDGGAYGITYKWRADGSDADLLPGSLNEDIVIQTASGPRTQTWFYPSRQACFSCHNDEAEHILGVNSRQLNGNFRYPSTGVTDNQLRVWSHLGLLGPALSDAEIASLARLVSVTDTGATLEHRVRSYIDANCAHCHRPNGPRGFFDARFDTPLSEQRIIDGPVANALGVTDARVVAPGSVERSLLHRRMNTNDGAKMPTLARNVIDHQAVTTLEQWVLSLGGSSGLPSPWVSGDIGFVNFAGLGTYSGGTYTLNGAGHDIWGSSDAFHFVRQAWTGDGEIIARVTGLQNTDPWAKAGIMFRETLAADSRNVFMCLPRNYGPTFQQRSGTSGTTSLASGSAGSTPMWLRLTRSGSTFRGYESIDGVNWILVGTATLSLPSSIFVGLAVTSHNPDALCTATFDNVSVSGGGSSPTGPAAPSNLVATAISSTQINLSWIDNASNEQGFEIERSTNGGTFAPIVTTAANATSYSSTGLTPATTYTYRVRATSSNGNSAYSSPASATTPSDGTPPPAGWTPLDIGNVSIAGSEEIGSTSVTVRGSGNDIWDTADGFRFLYRTMTGDGTLEARVVSITNTHSWAKAGVMIRESLTAGSANTAALVTAASGVWAQNRATAGGATTGSSGPWGVAAPYWVRLVRTGSNVVASASPDGATWATLGTYSVSTSTLFVGLAVTSHDNAALTSVVFDNIRAPGDSTSPTTPAAPSNLVATASANRIDLSWTDNANNEEGFSIERSVNGGGFMALASAGPNVTTYADTGLAAATTYSYRVRATHSAGNSAYSNSASATTPPPDSSGGAPGNLAAVAFSSTQINLSWTDNSGNENGFRIERATDGVNFVQVGTVGANVTSFANTGLTPSTSYSYRVSATFPIGQSAYSNVATATTAAGPSTPGTWLQADIGPVGVTGSDDTSSATIIVRGSGNDIWDTADGFRFVYRTLEGDGAIEARVISITNTHSWAKAGVMIRAALTANSANTAALVTAASGVYVQNRAAAGAVTTSHAGPWGVAAPYWVRLVRTGNSVAGAVSSDGVTWTPVSTHSMPSGPLYVGLAVTSHNNSVLATGTFDNVRINGVSGSDVVPAAPSNLVATAASASRIDLTWTNNATTEEGFAIERSTDGTTFTPLATVAANVTSYANTGLTASTTYTYRVRATHGAGNSAYSNTASATTLASGGGIAAPSNLVATAASATRIDLTWTDNSTTEEGFAVERSTDGTTFTPLATVGANVTSYANTGLTASTTYSYRVRATQGSGNSAYSNTASATTLAADGGLAAPTNLSAAVVSASSISLAWTDQSAGETGFRIERSSGGSGFVEIALAPANATQYSDTVLAASTSYSYRVRATLGSTHSAYSNTASATTPAAPSPDTWLQADIGSVGVAGSGDTSGSTITLRGSGSDIAGTADAFRFAYRTLTGDGAIEARVMSLTDTHNQAKAGVMMREDLTASSRHSATLITPSRGVVAQQRTTPGGSTSSTNGSRNAVPPYWVRLVRSGNVIVASTSPDGATWSTVATHTTSMGATVYVGLAVTSHSNANLATGVFDNVRITGGGTPVVPAAPSGLAASAVTSSRIDLSWSDNSTNEQGFAIERSMDGGGFVSVASVAANVTTYADTGLTAATTYTYRVRATNTAGSSAYSGTASATTPPGASLAAPSNLAANATSSTQVSLTWIDNSTGEEGFAIERLTGLGAFSEIATVGANITSYINTGLAPSTTYTYRVRARAAAGDSPYSNTIAVTTPAGPSEPAVWSHADVGPVGVAGSDDASGNTITVRGSGSDIWDTSDSFRFLYQTLTGDCVVEAQVFSLTNTHAWAKAGVMIRESLATNARNTFAFLTPSNGVGLQNRASPGGTTTHTPGPWGVGIPYWVRLARTGNTIVASASPDGVVWTTMGTFTVSMGATVHVGFAVTSHNNSVLSTAVFAEPFIQ